MKRLILRIIGLLPPQFARLLAHLVSPSYTVGAVAVFQLPDGAFLLLRQRHLAGWSLPGGLTKRGEKPAAALRREVLEEIGKEITPPTECNAVVIDAQDRRVDCVWVIPTEKFEIVAHDSEVQSFTWTTSTEGLTAPAKAALDSIQSSRSKELVF